MKRSKTILCLLLTGALLWGCALQTEPTKPAATPAAESVEIHILLTDAPTETPVPSPTPTPTPTPIPTPEPTATAEPTKDPNRKMVALTFDDGPTEEYTPLILDLAEEYGIHVTFFMQGNRLYQKDAIVQRALALGCDIGTHGWSHTDMTTLTRKELRDRFDRVEERISEMAEGGYDLRLMRPPYGNTNSDVYSAAASGELAVIKWSVDTLDWKSRDAAAILEICREEICDGSIVLFHDKFPSTVEAVKELIPWLLEQGYDLVTVTELIESTGEPLRAGGLYRNKYGK